MSLARLVNNKYIRKSILAVLDIIIVFVSYIISDFFVQGSFISNIEEYMTTCIIASILYIALFVVTKIYRSVTEYTGAREYTIYLLVSLCGGIITTICSYIIKFNMFSFKINILTSLFVAGFMVLMRVFYRSIVNRIQTNKNKCELVENVLVVGAGSAGLQVVRDLFPKINNQYKVVGMIDDSSFKENCIINGVQVFGGREKIIEVCEKQKVDIILFAIANISDSEKGKILEICSKTNAKVKAIPNVKEILTSNAPINMNSFKDIQIEDLLGRDPVKLDNDEIKNYIKDKVVVVTGGGGSIGSELCRQVASFGAKELVMIDIYENTLYEVELEIRKKYPDLKLTAIIASIRDGKRINEIFERYKPNMVFHAAAHKHVPLMETSPIEAIKNNVFGTYNVARNADKHGVERFILVSTDKAVNPTSIMGATKRICEMIIQMQNSRSKTNYVAVRFGNVLGSNGSVIPIFKKQIQEGGPVTVTHKDITRYFMTIPEAVGLILQAITFAEGGEIFVLDMGEPVRIYDLAEKMIKLSGHTPNEDIKIEVTGLRPGEKLYEELLVAEEGLSKTIHDKIMVTKIMDFDSKQMNKNLSTLRKLINSEYAKDNNKVKKIIKKIVPTFIEEKEHTKAMEDNINKEDKIKYIMTVEKEINNEEFIETDNDDAQCNIL